MKLNKIVFPLTLALMAILATTGCRSKGPVKTTTLPQHAIVENADPGLPPGNQVPQNPPSVGNEINSLADWPIGGFIQDPKKLAAYTVHFKYDSAVVDDSEQSNIASVSQALASDPTAKLIIEGHCDERGTEEYNRSLGERRALALREALARTGVDAMRIRTLSFGKDKPADPGHNEAAWSKNRRGEFIWCTPKTTAQ